MCGVIGLIVEREREDLGQVASKLLRMLEYRGYDSTGAILQGSSGIALRKDVGAPSAVTKRLGIEDLPGRVFCGQVRWATFGTVTRENAQPHEVRCKTHLYGAHNGNITNCDQLKRRLLAKGHAVVSDNDGEMLVHTVEHYFAEELTKIDADDHGERRKALNRAIVRASADMVGSFAAVVVDPVSQTVACIKAGSSLYLGVGRDPERGAFVIASSDLSSVLSMTKILVPLNEKEFCLYTAGEFQVHAVKNGAPIRRAPVRSRLRVEETKLAPPWRFFMEQEIHAQVSASAKLLALYTGRSERLDLIRALLAEEPDLVKNVKHAVKALADLTDPDELARRAELLLAAEELRRLVAVAGGAGFRPAAEEPFESSYANLLEDLRHLHPEAAGATLHLIDAVFLLDEVSDISSRIDRFVDRIAEAHEYGSSIYLLACGTSFHAAKTAAIFFDRIAGLNIFPILPGEFRSQYAHSIRDRDVVIGISQSGETKDLIDVYNLVRESGRAATLIAIVNNTNSTLALEKSELYVPLFCGPEIAVPATKSFLNQLLVLYVLALRVAERFAHLGIRRIDGGALARAKKNLFRVPSLVEETLRTSGDAVARAAGELHLAPSIHILATGMLGIAKEGALKIREVVLNHTEGFEASEFKHGPNTILGLNTLYGPQELHAFLAAIAGSLERAATDHGKRLGGREAARLLALAADRLLLGKESGVARDREQVAWIADPALFSALYRPYPLVFVTGPNERDVNLTISQINTHKIRGASVFMIAEENPFLREAVEKSPDLPGASYRCGYIPLPETGDEILCAFTSAVVLQTLALAMSVRKMELLDRLGLLDHGVHPDAPKNVSKSITVD